MNNKAMFKISYGLYVLTAKRGDKDNGCIINTAVQVASEPNTISIAVTNLPAPTENRLEMHNNILYVRTPNGLFSITGQRIQ